MGPGESGLEFVWALDPNSLASKPLSDSDVIDAIAGHGVALRRRVDVLEGETDLKIHLEATLRLADEAEVRIVHHHMQIGQFVLRADRKFLDHELKIVIA